MTPPPRRPRRRPRRPSRPPGRARLAVGSVALCAVTGLAVVLLQSPDRAGTPTPAAAEPAPPAPVPAVGPPDTPSPRAEQPASAASSAGGSPAGPATTTAPAAGGAADLGGCPVAPADSIWRTPVDRLPAAADSAALVAAIGTAKHLKADFGAGTWEGAPFGIPITAVPPGTPTARVAFDYAEESDRGPYPIPAYELYDAHPQGDGSWRAASGAVFDLRSNALRPTGRTSADAAGLPILPGLARYDEASGGTIDHALRITVPRSRKAALWPARHQAGSSTDAALPPMGLRLRLKAGVDVSGLPPQARAVAQALKTYGAIVADNGSAWYVSGTQDDRWDNTALARLGALTGADFEAVDVSALQLAPDSAAARHP
ncbi:hypothetical protein [Kitasatospora sp. NPDC088346]|uniref:hypothetical protein n=1 Tax=Kitasatospora sp. NPDC088346 TaxID=3364073 RepID=UPI00382C2E97